MNISFNGAKISDFIAPFYLQKEAKKNTVAILGASKTTEQIEKYMQACSDITKGLILSGKSIVHGCGNAGIMGAAYNAGKDYSQKDENGKPKQNLAIIQNPMWGDEDLDNCIPLTTTNSEAERIEKFAQVADNILVFPGSATTLQEATTLITKNYYGKPQDKKNIIFVGKDYYKGLKEQYDKLFESGLIKCPPEELFTIVDSKEEALKLIK